MLLLDDQLLRSSALTKRRVSSLTRRGLLWVVAIGYLVPSLLTLWATGSRLSLSDTSRAVLNWTSPFHLANGYGLFAVMTTSRPEIIIEGSKDGSEWHAYELPFKPGALDRAPVWATPHQPRLDWQLWFAALAPANRNPWLQGLMVGLLRGSEPVKALFEDNPFPEEPPRFIRAQLYQYHFTTDSERETTGNWWTRQQAGVFFQPVRLSE